MVISQERFENLLIETIEAKNEFQFKYIVNDLRVNLNQKLECLGNLSIFETVLLTPKSQKFIEICLSKNCSFYKKNDVGIYPLRYAINSLSADNLRTLINSPPISSNADQAEINHSMIVNEKLEDGNNYLHFLVNVLTDENSLEVSEMIKLMIKSRCNSNLRNNRQQTPLQLLLQDINNDRHELVNIFANNSAGELLDDDVIEIMVDRGISFRTTARQELIYDGKLMIHLLDQWDEIKFLELFGAFEDRFNTSNQFHSECGKMLEVAISQNMSEATALLMKRGVCVNTITVDSKFKKAPAFLACNFGHHQVLKVLIDQPILKMKCLNARRNLLHQICLAKNVHPADRLKCFDLIIGDSRCKTNIINGLDGEGQAPLYYACYNGHDEIAKELLRRGAFVGRKSIINCIDKDVFKEFLDECIKCTSSVKNKDCEIHVDFRFLTPPDVINEFHPEIVPVQEIATNHKLKELILHPVISSFLNLKWKKINCIVYCNLLIYFCFMLFLGAFIIRFFHDSVYLDYNFTAKNKTEIEVELGDRHDFSERPGSSGSQDSGGFGGAGGFGGGFIASETDMQNRNSFSEIPAFPAFGVTSTVRPISEPEPPASKPNLFALLLGFTSSEARNSRSKRSTESKTTNQWNEKFERLLDENLISYRFCLFGVILMTIYEIIQCTTSIKTYFFKLSNWLDLSLIFLSYLVLVGSFNVEPDDFKKVRALTILVMAAQSIQLIAKVSVLSMSLHMAIFKRVCATFLKTIALYLILILAFAMSFYTLKEQSENDKNNEKDEKGNLKIPGKSDDDDDDSFANPFIAIITTVRMMLSDFDTVKIDGKDTFQGIMFLLFVVLITVVLFNLLNALAISDTNEIMKDAELVDTKKRISILFSYEKLFIFLTLSFANIFPEMSTITIKPNRGNTEIHIKKQIKNDDDRTLMSVPRKIENFFDKMIRKLTFWKKGKSMNLGKVSTKRICDFLETQQRSRLISDTLESHAIFPLVKEMEDKVVKKICKQDSLTEVLYV